MPDARQTDLTSTSHGLEERGRDCVFGREGSGRRKEKTAMNSGPRKKPFRADLKEPEIADR